MEDENGDYETKMNGIMKNVNDLGVNLLGENIERKKIEGQEGLEKMGKKTHLILKNQNMNCGGGLNVFPHYTITSHSLSAIFFFHLN